MIRVCAKLHFNTCRKQGSNYKIFQCYEQLPELVETGHKVRVTTLLNQKVVTGQFSFCGLNLVYGRACKVMFQLSW